MAVFVFYWENIEDNVGGMTVWLSTLIQRSWKILPSLSVWIVWQRTSVLKYCVNWIDVFGKSDIQLISYANQESKYTLYASIQTEKTLLW
jgi:hypothetical protein